ncbi:LINE-1 retrotransposable element ORF1 protein [Scomber scombrus]|uniref:LINE-1 retrotransposable element ORF1 protein n=1 Tax=Scomber scombrus TaxID=13677 RepID=A0AAV1QB14_SCOSC
MIARIHHFQIKEKILQLSRQLFPLTYNEAAIHVFPDLPVEVIKQRQAFENVRKKFKVAGARVGFIYPARLWVTLGNSEQIFSSLQEAEVFAGTLS